jgi:hypothetical protein
MVEGRNSRQITAIAESIAALLSRSLGREKKDAKGR